MGLSHSTCAIGPCINPNFAGDWLPSRGSNGKVLDIGCGGAFDKMIPLHPRLEKADLDGVDPSPAVMSHPLLRRRWHAPFEEAAIPEKEYDLAYAFNVVEHIVAPDPFFRQLRRVLKPGGVFWAMTPNGHHPFTWAVRAFQAMGLKQGAASRHPNVNDYPAYYRLNTPRSVAAAAERQGFDRAGIRLYAVRPMGYLFPSSHFNSCPIRTTERWDCDGGRPHCYWHIVWSDLVTHPAGSHSSNTVAAGAINAGHPPLRLAIISNSLTPYRSALDQRRIVHEMPEVELWSILTHQVSNAAWQFDPPKEIRAVLFGPGRACNRPGQTDTSTARMCKGGKIARWLREHRIEAVLLEGYNDPGRLRILSWCRRNDVPCLMWGDSNIRGDRRHGIAAWLKRLVVSRILSQCSAVLACGIGGRQYFAKYGVSDDRIFYYPVEPDYRQIEDLPAPTITAVRNRFGLAEGRRRMVFSGRLAEAKRPELLIDAFSVIADSRPQWDVVMMGDGPMRSELERRVPTSLRQRILWTGFIDDQAVVNGVYRSCDVLVLPSDYEPWALVVNEAAAAGLAIVASDVVGAAAELVRDGVNGFCFPAGDCQALSACLLQITDPEAIDHYRAASATVLADWRRRGDPIAGLRQALQAVKGLDAGHDRGSGGG